MQDTDHVRVGFVAVVLECIPQCGTVAVELACVLVESRVDPAYELENVVDPLGLGLRVANQGGPQTPVAGARPFGEIDETRQLGRFDLGRHRPKPTTARGLLRSAAMPDNPTHDPIVEIDGLWKSFGAVHAVEDLTFSVLRGQVYGLLGPNGAGKTTTLRVLMGLERATRGETRLFGTRVTPSSRELARVGAMVEQAAFVPHLSGMRNLRLWWEAGGGRMKDADLDGALAIAGLGKAL